MKNFFYIALLVLISCSSKTDSNVSDNFHIPIIQPKGSEQYLQLGSDYIFNQDSLHTFELIIPEKSLAKIDNIPLPHPRSKTFEYFLISYSNIFSIINCVEA